MKRLEIALIALALYTVGLCIVGCSPSKEEQNSVPITKINPGGFKFQDGNVSCYVFGTGISCLKGDSK